MLFRDLPQTKRRSFSNEDIGSGNFIRDSLAAETLAASRAA